MKFATIKIATMLLCSIVAWSSLTTSAEACRRCRGYSAYRPYYSSFYAPSYYGYSSYYGYGSGYGYGYGSYYGANCCQPACNPCSPCGISSCSPCGSGGCATGNCTVMSSPTDQKDGWTPTQADQPKTFDDSQPDARYDEPSKSNIPDGFGGGRQSAPDTTIPSDDQPSNPQRSFRPPADPAEEVIPKKEPAPTPAPEKTPASDNKNPEVNNDAKPTIPVIPDLGRGLEVPKHAFKPGALGWDSRLTWRSEPQHRRLYIRSLLRKPAVKRQVVDPNSEWQSASDQRIAIK